MPMLRLDELASDDGAIGCMALAVIASMLLLAMPSYTSYQTPLLPLDFCLLAASASLSFYLIRRHDRLKRAYATSIRVTVSLMTSLFCCVVFMKDLGLMALA